MRIDLNEIQHWITQGSRILDLGCGDGTLLKFLIDTKQVQGYGLEIDAEQINTCIDKGLNVIEQNLDRGLGNFADKSFDTVLMTQALQTLHFPHLVLDEMLRVGKECIVTFPNFGHWKARFYLATRGRMPVSDLLPYEWYDTPNIHFCTFKDFEVLCRERNIKVIHRQVVNEQSGQTLKDFMPNLFGETAIYHLSK
ncbi:methionine biosynthesis protein MetW [Cellvibrio sp. BR]|jgi:methionine biosynthesis protein MetW|uniref:methionine biosynthesis protein MetW n=1 Tax=unclassified Cellvibrio TaxID=2624793 RepID=UPI0002600FCD|nr:MULTISPECIES: methionine biosynthesis protein MetW [unclassified Cellvibrio]EIK46600.1 methionine biosynthesis protein MetW [Cellvibrio sp. BR]QEY11382.1 methionine biosynthesis protein MetW [Cellvibrio sp. KY-YJ-3]UUA71500.1 methionine biosynthesis protein MetW [Cellvibrio sp. QJXJ]